MALVAGTKGRKPPEPRLHAIVAGSKGVRPPRPVKTKLSGA